MESFYDAHWTNTKSVKAYGQREFRCRTEIAICFFSLFFDGVKKSNTKGSDSNYQVENCLKYLHEVWKHWVNQFLFYSTQSFMIFFAAISFLFDRQQFHFMFWTVLVWKSLNSYKSCKNILYKRYIRMTHFIRTLNEYLFPGLFLSSFHIAWSTYGNFVEWM